MQRICFVDGVQMVAIYIAVLFAVIRSVRSVSGETLIGC